ncbi:MAG: hypothetical protein WCJ30_26475 [Deltaproteobacteria bacterium]
MTLQGFDATNSMSVSLSGAGNSLAVLGSSMLGPVLGASENQFLCGSPTGLCDFVGTACRVDIIRAGSLYGEFEARLSEPCELNRRNDTAGLAPASITLLSIQARGTLQLGAITGARTDCSLDGGSSIDDACSPPACTEFR